MIITCQRCGKGRVLPESSGIDSAFVCPCYVEIYNKDIMNTPTPEGFPEGSPAERHIAADNTDARVAAALDRHKWIKSLNPELRSTLGQDYVTLYDAVTRLQGELAAHQKQIDADTANIDDMRLEEIRLKTALSKAEAENARLRIVIEKNRDSAGAGRAIGITHGAINWRDALDKIHAQSKAALATREAEGAG